MRYKRIGFVVLIILAAAGYMVYQGGSEKGIEPGKTGAVEDPAEARTFQEAQTVTRNITEYYRAVGTVKPESESRIESRIKAQVKSIHVGPGDSVKRGDIMVTLDDRQPVSRLEKAKQALKGAKAARSQAAQQVESAKAALKEARLNYQRIQEYVKADAATSKEMENAESNYLQAKAGLSRARQALVETASGIRRAENTVEEAEVELEFTQITAPIEGEVIRRMVEPGDLALPGKPLVLMRTRKGFRLEAHVRAELVKHIARGQTLKAEIPTLDTTVDAVVNEIVPWADPETRSFLVKAVIPSVKGLYPGMYGKLLIPESETRVVLIPESALITTGQLDLVMVKDSSGWSRRYIKTGKKRDGMIEVLSGLRSNETISTGSL
mgnify:CR=1 FL=1